MEKILFTQYFYYYQINHQTSNDLSLHTILVFIKLSMTYLSGKQKLNEKQSENSVIFAVIQIQIHEHNAKQNRIKIRLMIG